MTDANMMEAKMLEAKKDEQPITPEQAQEDGEYRIAEAQRHIQMMEGEIAKGRRMLTITCLNLANLAINLLPRPEQGEETTKGKKNPQKRMLTLSDLDKVSAIVERLTQASAHLSAGGSSMMRGPTMR